MILVFLCIAHIIVCAGVFTGALTNSKLSRLVVEKISMSHHSMQNNLMKSERTDLIFR